MPVYVLIGGESQRFGSAKASHLVDGVPWAIDVGRRLAGNDSFTLVGRGADALTGTRRISDSDAGVGPLSGALAAITDRVDRDGPGMLALASCDLVRPEREWLDLLLAEHRAADGSEIAAYHVGDRWQPFPSVVSTAWLETLRVAIESGIRSFQDAFDRSRACRVVWPHGGDGPPQANTPEELAELLRG